MKTSPEKAHPKASRNGAGPRTLILASLLPNRMRPRQGMYNYQQFKELSALCPLSAVSPTPFHLLLDWRPGLKTPGLPFKVRRPVYWYAPRMARGLHGRFFLASSCFSLKKTVKEFKPRVLLLNWAYPDAWAGMRLARAQKLPYVLQALGSDINIFARDPARKPFIIEALHRANQVVAVSRPLGGRIRDLGVDDKRISVLLNGVDHDRFHLRPREDARKKLGLKSENKLLLYAGNLLPVKGPDLALHALSHLPDARLLMLGDGPMRGGLEKMAAGLGMKERVSFLGARPHGQVADYLAACDLLLLPSRNEGDPNIVLEALASGRPVAAFGVGGVPAILGGDLALGLARPEDAQDLARAARELLESNPKPEHLAHKVAHRSWRANAVSLCRILDRAAIEGPIRS